MKRETKLKTNNGASEPRGFATVMSPEVYTSNRTRLRKMLLTNSLVVFNANDIPPTNADGTLGKVANSDLFYLTGVEQEASILVMYPDAEEEKYREILFLREPTAENELWEGHKLTKQEARELTGVQNVHWLSDFPCLFHRLICECEHVYLNTNEHKRAVIEVESRDARFIESTMRRYPLHDYQRVAPLMHRLRAQKSDAEVAAMRRACRITGQGFERVVKFVKPGVSEREVEAEYAHEFIRNYCRFAYQPIIASGLNACSLHYLSNSAICRKGELLLVDVAAAYCNYNADLTRTIPVSGKFTRRQKRVYNAVLRVLRECVKGLTPGKKPRDWQKEAEQIMEKELVDLGLLTTTEIARQNPENPAFKKYFMHGVGHPLGLDVHDVGITTEPMQNGWVMTVEPAIYVREEGFAVRLENNILVTESGPVDLMAEIPIEAEEIEEMMNSRSENPARENSNGHSRDGHNLDGHNHDGHGNGALEKIRGRRLQPK